MSKWNKMNWVDATITKDSGKKVDSTQMLKGEGAMSSDQNESNPQKEYKTSGKGFSGPFGDRLGSKG